MAEESGDGLTDKAKDLLRGDLVNEFFGLVIGRLIPGSVATYLYVNHQALPEHVFPDAYLFFCCAWFVGSALDLVSNTIFALPVRPKYKYIPETSTLNPGFKYFINFRRCHSFGPNLAMDVKRKLDWFEFDKIFFRGMGLISLAVCVHPPAKLPMLDWKLCSWEISNRQWGVIGILICLTYWKRQQDALNRQEDAIHDSTPPSAPSPAPSPNP